MADAARIGSEGVRGVEESGSGTMIVRDPSFWLLLFRHWWRNAAGTCDVPWIPVYAVTKRFLVAVRVMPASDYDAAGHPIPVEWDVHLDEDEMWACLGDRTTRAVLNLLRSYRVILFDESPSSVHEPLGASMSSVHPVIPDGFQMLSNELPSWVSEPIGALNRKMWRIWD